MYRAHDEHMNTVNRIRLYISDNIHKMPAAVCRGQYTTEQLDEVNDKKKTKNESENSTVYIKSTN
jgi:hypothetical protein